MLSSVIVQAIRNAPHPPTATQEPPTGLQRAEYQRHLAGEPMLDYLKVGNAEVFIVSSSNIGVNLYKILEEIKPQSLVLQAKADEIFYKNFKVLTPFERLLNLNMKYSPQDVMPSYTHYAAAKEHLTNLGYKGFVQTMNPTDHKPYKTSSRLSLEALTYACTWGLHTGLEEIVLGGMPLVLQYAMMSRQFCLVQLVQLMGGVCASLGKHPDLIARTEPELPLIAASKLYSDVFLTADDDFTAQSVHSLSTSSNSIVVLTGTGQHYGLRHFLEQPPREPDLSLSTRMKSIVRTDITEVVIDKIAFLDAVFNGPTIIYKVLESPCNYRALELIRQLVEEDVIKSQVEWSSDMRARTIDMHHKLYLSMLMKHCTFLKKELKRGKDQLHADFLKTMLDSLV